MHIRPSLFAALAPLACAGAPARAQTPPPVAWTFESAEIADMAAVGGQAVLLTDTTLSGVRDGKAAWSVTVGENEGWVLPLATGCVLVGLSADSELACFNLTDGGQRWRISGRIPAGAGTQESRVLSATARGPDHVLVLMSDGRWGNLDPKACEGAGGNCLVVDADVSVSYPSWLDRLSANAAGVRTRNNFDRIVLYDAAGQKLAVLVVDRGLRRVGARAWRAKLDAAGEPVVVGDTAYVGCWRENDEMFVTVADLCAVDVGSGKLRWRQTLDLKPLGFLDSTSVHSDGKFAYVGTRTQVVALAVGPTGPP